MNFIDNLSQYPWLAYGVVGFVGACFGSFLTLLSHRLPRGEPVVSKRSRCPSCETPLAVRDLVPVLSWCISTGTCRYCRVKIPVRYPLIELVTMGSFLLLYHAYGFTVEGVILTGLVCCVIGLIVTDLEHYMIPDTFQIVMALLALAYGFMQEWELLDMMTAAVAGVAIGLALIYGFRWWRQKEALGFGDVKLLGVAGLWLGIEALIPFLFYAGILGIMSAMLWRLLGRGAVFPFGPALALSMLLCIFFPEVPNAFWSMDQWIVAWIG